MDVPVRDMQSAGIAGVQADNTNKRISAIRVATKHMSDHVKWHQNMNFMMPQALKPWRPYCTVLGVWEGFVGLQLRLGPLIQEVCSHPPSSSMSHADARLHA
jgi:hypothetical protein